MYDLATIAEIVGGELYWGGKTQGQGQPAGVSIDSRRLRPGDVFFAIRGEARDGHQFVPHALERGAVGAVVSRDWPEKPAPDVGGGLIRVADPLRALQTLAAHYRRSLDIRVAAVTGSNGKTTTKEMAARVLATRYRTAKTEGNLNNHLGVPLTLLALPREAEVAVIEMGMNHLGEIRRLAEMSDPEIGLVTNIGEGHLEFLGSMDNVLCAKGELLEYLKPEHVAILNADDPYLGAGRLSIRARTLTFGVDGPADVRATDVTPVSGEGARFSLGGRTVQLGVPGREFVYDALAAVAVGVALGVPEADACEALAGFRPYRMRMEVLRLGPVTVIDDTYNANPASVRAALETLGSMEVEGRRIAVLGDMLELGADAGRLHRDVGRWVARTGVDALFTLGPLAAEIRAGAVSAGLPGDRAVRAEDREELGRVLSDAVGPGDVVLVKGSRRCRMETVVEALRTHLEERG